MNVTLSVIHISFLWTYPNEYPSYVILVFLNLVSHSRSWKRSPGWLAPFFRQYWPKKLLTVSIVKENFPGISIQWWFLLWQANAPSLARGAVVLRSLRGATSLHGISGDNKALCGERVSPSWKEFRLCSRPELSSLTNVQLIVGDTGADKAFSECFWSLNKSTTAQVDHIKLTSHLHLAGKCRKSGGNYVFFRKLERLLWLILCEYSKWTRKLTLSNLKIVECQWYIFFSGHTQGRKTSSVRFATNGLCAQITSGSNTHLTLDQIRPAQNHCHTHTHMISIHLIGFLSLTIITI